MIRVHFLTHAIINYIENKVKQKTRRRQNISDENFYGEMLPQFGLYCLDRKDVQYIKEQIERLVKASA